MDAEFLFELGYAEVGRGILLLRQLFQLLVGCRIDNDGSEVCEFGLRLAQGLNGGDDRVQLGELPRQLNAGRLVDALAQLGLDRLPALNELVELLGGYGGHL